MTAKKTKKAVQPGALAPMSGFDALVERVAAIIDEARARHPHRQYRDGAGQLAHRARDCRICAAWRAARRQKRITFDDDHLFIDLVFYNILLKCYLLIDLKLGKLTHQDVGQMDSYVRIFGTHERAADDWPTIGLILCAQENHTIARYSVLSEHKQLFAAKYVTYLPTEEQLRQALERDRRIADAIVDAPGTDKAGPPKRALRANGRKG